MVDNTETAQDQPGATDAPPPEASKDVIPEADVDQQPSLPEPPAAEAAAEEPAPEPESGTELMPGQVGYNDQQRENIAKMYREQRDAAKADTDADEASELAEQPGDAAAQQVAEPAAEPTAESAPAPAEAKLETLVVDKQTIHVTPEEKTALAQINLAAKNRLDESNQLLDSIKEVFSKVPVPADQSGQGAPGQEPSPEPAEAPEVQTNGLDREKLSDIAQRLQVGDEEDAEAALEELLSMSRGSTAPVDPAQIEQIVDHRVASSQRDIEFKAALSQFGDNFPKIMANEDLGRTSINVAARHMRSEMQEKAGLSDDALRQLGNDTNAISATYRELLMQGHQLKPYHQLFTDVGEEMTETFNLGDTPAPTPPPPDDPNPGQGAQPTTRTTPNNAEQIQKRTVRKRAAQQQPTAAGGRQPQAPAKPRGKTSAEVVQEMRRQRGYPVHS